MDMDAVGSLFRLLGDATRLRLLRVLQTERLNVTELTAVLGVAQSGVSRHLGLLKDAGLLTEHRDGGFTYYAAPIPSAQTDAPLWAFLQDRFASVASDEAVLADQARLAEVLRVRKENFDVHGGDGSEGRQLVPGRSWPAWARALGHLLPPLDVADLGCGEGYLTVESARWAKRVVAVDRSPAVLARARSLAKRCHVSNVTWKRGELDALPIRTASVDVALLSQALHHAEEPARAVAEAVRVLRPGGRLLVLDLRQHGQAWVRDRLGDRWLGFDDEALAALLTDAGLRDVRVGIGARRAGDPFVVLVASGVKGAPGRQRRQRSR